MTEINEAGGQDGVTYPHVRVQLSGTDGNVFALMGRVTRAMQIAGVPADGIQKLESELFACGSYDEALQLFMRTVVVS